MAPSIPRPNPVRFFLWGTIKQRVYDGRDPVNSREELIARIEEGFDAVRNEDGMVSNAIRSTVHRARQCIAVRGGHFEHLL